MPLYSKKNRTLRAAVKQIHFITDCFEPVTTKGSNLRLLGFYSPLVVLILIIYLVFPFALVSLWATAMAFQRPDTFCLEESGLSQNNTSSAPCPGKNQTCWEGYTEQPLTYILSIPMTIVLAVRLEY